MLPGTLARRKSIPTIGFALRNYRPIFGSIRLRFKRQGCLSSTTNCVLKSRVFRSGRATIHRCALGWNGHSSDFWTFNPRVTKPLRNFSPPLRSTFWSISWVSLSKNRLGVLARRAAPI